MGDMGRSPGRGIPLGRGARARGGSGPILFRRAICERRIAVVGVAGSCSIKPYGAGDACAGVPGVSARDVGRIRIALCERDRPPVGTGMPLCERRLGVIGRGVLGGTPGDALMLDDMRERGRGIALRSSPPSCADCRRCCSCCMLLRICSSVDFCAMRRVRLSLIHI